MNEEQTTKDETTVANPLYGGMELLAVEVMDLAQHVRDLRARVAAVRDYVRSQREQFSQTEQTLLFWCAQANELLVREQTTSVH